MTRAFEVDDLYLQRNITELDGSPDGAAVACTVRSIDRGADDYRSVIWRFGITAGEPRQLTHGPGSDSSPRWSPGGDCLAFISDRGGTTQVYILRLDGGEARQLGRFDGAVSTIQWHPDGGSLIAAAAVEVDPDWRGQRANGRKPKERVPGAPEVCWRLPYKADGAGYTLAREIHLFRLDASTGEIRQLTDGSFDVVAHAVSPDGSRIAYSRTRGGRLGHRTDLWVCGIDGSGARQLTQDLPMVMQPVWSPDGSRIAVCGAKRDGDANMNLWVVDAASGSVSQLGDESLTASDPASLRWTKDGAALVFARAHCGRHEVARIAADGGTVQTVHSGDMQFGAFAHAGDGRFVYALEHPAHPCELHAAREGDSGSRQLSHLNEWWGERTKIRAEARSFDVPDGKGGTERIEGWLLRPEGRSGPLPLLNDVHGGPASHALLDFDSNVFWQVLCSRGWAVLALNAVGSASYGSEFCDRLEGRWGELDLPQHLAAIRQLQDEGLCDGRVGISGKSYGGYLAAWAVGNSGLFRAAVVMAPVGNIETHYGTSDGGYYADPLYMGSGKRFDRALARKLSPMKCIAKSSAPTLFIQGKEDERCPKCQAEELFVTMMAETDTPAELVMYASEGHAFLASGKPSVRADASARIVEWLERYAGREPQK